MFDSVDVGCFFFFIRILCCCLHLFFFALEKKEPTINLHVVVSSALACCVWRRSFKHSYTKCNSWLIRPLSLSLWTFYMYSHFINIFFRLLFFCAHWVLFFIFLPFRSVAGVLVHVLSLLLLLLFFSSFVGLCVSSICFFVSWTNVCDTIHTF